MVSVHILSVPQSVELSLCRHKYVTSSVCSGFGGAPLVAVLVVYYKLRTMTATVRQYYIQPFLSIRTRGGGRGTTDSSLGSSMKSVAPVASFDHVPVSCSHRSHPSFVRSFVFRRHASMLAVATNVKLSS
jgi:hypothetical protein